MSRKEYGRGESGARKKRVYPSRAKTPAGKKRALIRAKTREAEERFKLEQLEKQRREEIKEAKTRGEKPPKPQKTVIGQALAATRKAVAWVEAQVKAIADALFGDPHHEFYEFAHGPLARDHLRILSDKPRNLKKLAGEQISGRIAEYVNRDTLQLILSIIDVGAERLRGNELWNINVYLFSDAKELVGSPSPIENANRFQAAYMKGGIGESYARAREHLEGRLRHAYETSGGLVYALSYTITTHARNEP